MIRLFVFAALAYAAYIVYQAEHQPAATPPPTRRRKPRPAAETPSEEG